MTDSISRESWHVAECAIQSIYGSPSSVVSLENWGHGALNHCFKVTTNLPGKLFFLKIENEEIIPSTRRGQIEREVYSIHLMQNAGIDCPAVFFFDFSGKKTGRRCLLEEFIDALLFWEIRGQMTELEQEALQVDMNVILEKMKDIRSTLFGDVYPGGIIGQHPSWPDVYQRMVHLLLADAEEMVIFSQKEMSQVEEAFTRCLAELTSTGPAGYYHGDLGLHNVMVDHSKGYARLGQVIDFGNAMFYPRYVNDAYTRKYGQFGLEPVDVEAGYGVSLQEQAANDLLFTLENTIFRALLKQKYNHNTGDFTGQFLGQIPR